MYAFVLYATVMSLHPAPKTAAGQHISIDQVEQQGRCSTTDVSQQSIQENKVQNTSTHLIPFARLFRATHVVIKIRMLDAFYYG